MNSSKVVLITGASSGLGLHTALRAAKQGFTVVATMRNPDSKSHSLLDAAQREGVSIHVDELDVQKRGTIDACVARTIAAHGKIDILINNAGFGMTGFLELATEAQIQENFDVNTFGVMRCIQAVLPHMRQRRSGHIITISSVAGLTGRPTNEIYCAAKFAVEGLMEGLATYLEPFFGIHCSLLEPAHIHTGFVSRIVHDLSGGAVSPADEGEAMQLITPEFVQKILGEYNAEYAPILWANLQAMQQNGALENSQRPEEVAEIVLQAMLDPKPRMRYQSSDFARNSCMDKLAADPDGEKQQARTRSLLLGIQSSTEETLEQAH